MLRRLKRKYSELFRKVTPNYLFAFLMVMYRILNPLREKILLFPFDGSWMAVLKDGLKFFMPTPKVFWIMRLCEEYETFLKVEKGDIVLDVGANIGGFTIPAARKVGEEGCIIAIEPEPKNLACLHKSIAVNHLQNVRIIEKGAFNCRKKMRFHISNDFNIDAHSLIYEVGKKSIEVYTDTLDNIVYELGLPRVDFIKMDIEGAEIEAFKGAESVLGMARKVVVAAYHLRNGKKTLSFVRWFLEARGFKIRIGSNDLVHAWKNNAKQ